MKKKLISGLLIAGLIMSSVGASFGTAMASNEYGELNKERTVALQMVETNGNLEKQQIKKSNDNVYYSNLADKNSRTKVKKLMKDAGISRGRQQVFWAHVDQYNKAVPKSMLVSKLTKYNPNKSKYDPYDIQDKWDEKYPDYMGQNCRMTAATIFGGNYKVKTKTVRDDLLMFDKRSAADDPWVKENKIKTKWWFKYFTRVFSMVPTTNSKNPKVHAKIMEKDWKKRGITFTKNKTASLITVVFHDNIDGSNLSIGHTGVLFKEGKSLWFLEKIAFQEPYQLTKFQNRAQLNKYLMDKYDVDENQPTAPPFIMENGHLMDGYKQTN